MPKPDDRNGVQRFLGMCQYLSKFCPRLSEVVLPLRDLIKMNVEFMWTDVREKSFNSAKDLITSRSILQYYDVTLPVVLQVDASEEATGGVILQDGRPVCFTSHTLDLTEKNYAQIEKECLAIVTSGTFQRLQRETSTNIAISALYKMVKQGLPSDKALLPPEIRAYRSFRDEISIHEGVLSKSDQVIIPSSLRKEMLTKIHKAHQGADSSIRRAGETLFWPAMSAAIRHACSTGCLCAQYKAERPTEPMQSQEIPQLPWERISVDLFELDGKQYLVSVDHYSDFIEIDWSRNTSATAVINAMKKKFCSIRNSTSVC